MVNNDAFNQSVECSSYFVNMMEAKGDRMMKYIMYAFIAAIIIFFAAKIIF